MFDRLRAGFSRPARPLPRTPFDRGATAAALDTVDTIAARLDHIHGYLLGEREELAHAPVRQLPAEPPARPDRRVA